MKMKGFTLIELVTVLSVIAILALISGVSSQLFVRKNEQQIIIDEIRTSIQFARAEAVNSGKSIVLTSINEEKDWSKGLSLGRYDKKSNEFVPFYQRSWHHPRWRIEWLGVNHSNRIYFSSNPFDALSNGHFELSNQHSNHPIKLILNRLGRVKVEIPAQ